MSEDSYYAGSRKLSVQTEILTHHWSHWVWLNNSGKEFKDRCRQPKWMCTALDLQENTDFIKMSTLTFYPIVRWTFWTNCNLNHSFLTHCKYEKHEHYCTKRTFYTLLCLFTWESFLHTIRTAQFKPIPIDQEVKKIC